MYNVQKYCGVFLGLITQLCFVKCQYEMLNMTGVTLLPLLRYQCIVLMSDGKLLLIAR